MHLSPAQKPFIKPQKEHHLMPHIPELAIAAGILDRAVEDWNKHRRQYERDLRVFFYSEWFDNICVGLNINPDTVRAKCEGLAERK